jgi:periplasmic protein TonB
MLDDFCQSSTAKQSRKRLGSSVAAAILLYGVGGAAAVYATAGIHPKAEEELEAVEFAPPPEPEPPAPVEQEVPKEKPKPKPKKPQIKVPVKISEEVLDESDKELADAGDVGPVDGTGTNAPAPPPPPPPPKKAGPVTKPVDSGSNRYDRLKYPPAAQRKGIEGAVVVSFDVLENGMVGNARIVSGPAEFHEIVLKAAATWRFTPARQDGKPVRFKGMTKRVVFRLEDA